MRLWYFLSSVNSFFKRACAAVQWARSLMFGRTLPLRPYFYMCANSEGSGETARMRRLAWAFAGRQCDIKYHKCGLQMSTYYQELVWVNINVILSITLCLVCCNKVTTEHGGSFTTINSAGRYVGIEAPGSISGYTWVFFVSYSAKLWFLRNKCFHFLVELTPMRRHKV